jgi:RNA ligase (TIGR02306 family)
MSTHSVNIYKLDSIQKHPNADTLGVTHILGFQCIVRLADFKEGDLVAYIEPDYIVPQTPEFTFLGKHRRIKAQKLRGVWSQGLIIKAPEGSKPGDDVMEQLGVTRYEPQLPSWWGVSGPAVGVEEEVPESLKGMPVYDLENWRKYPDIFVQGDEVSITEKIHGTNARFAFRDGRMWCGGRRQWRKEEPKNYYWEALKQNPWIEDWCKASGMVLYGEVFGDVQDLKYGHRQGKVTFLAFDVYGSVLAELVGGVFRGAHEFKQLVPKECRVPELYCGPYNKEIVEKLSLQNSTLANHCAEGVVIKPMLERWNPDIGRVALKAVSSRYLERAK